MTEEGLKAKTEMCVSVCEREKESRKRKWLCMSVYERGRQDKQVEGQVDVLMTEIKMGLCGAVQCRCWCVQGSVENQCRRKFRPVSVVLDRWTGKSIQVP